MRWSIASDVYHSAAYNLGTILEQQGDRQGAIRSYRAAAKLAPFDVDSLLNLGSALLAEGRDNAAVHTYITAAELEEGRNDPSVHYGLSLAMDTRGAVGDLDAAKDALDRALSLDPNAAAARVHAGVMAERRGDYSAAAGAYKTALRGARPSPHLFLRLGGALMRAELVQRISKLYPSSLHIPNANAALVPEKTAEAFSSRRVDRGELRPYHSSNSSLKILNGAVTNITSLDRHQHVTHQVSAYDTANSANGWIGGDGLGAVVRSLSVLEGTTVIRGFQDGYGGVATHIAGALDTFRKAIKLDPRIEARAHIGIGLCLELTNECSGAITSYRRCVELNPRDADGHERLGVLLERSPSL